MSQVNKVLSRDKPFDLCLILKFYIEQLVNILFSVLVPTINCPFPVYDLYLPDNSFIISNLEEMFH